MYELPEPKRTSACIPPPGLHCGACIVGFDTNENGDENICSGCSEPKIDFSTSVFATLGFRSQFLQSEQLFLIFCHPPNLCWNVRNFWGGNPSTSKLNFCLTWPGDSQRESGQLARFDSHESIRRPKKNLFSQHSSDSRESPQTSDSQFLAPRSAICKKRGSVREP